MKWKPFIFISKRCYYAGYEKKVAKSSHFHNFQSLALLHCFQSGRNREKRGWARWVLRWKTFICSKALLVQEFLGFYFNITLEMLPPQFPVLFLSLCWTLQESSDMISKPRICPSKITGENAAHFLLPCFQEQTSLMLFLRFF